MKYKIVGLGVDIGTYDSFRKRIISNAKSFISSYVCVANVHMSVEAYDDPSFANIVDASFLTTPDGMPLAKGISFLYGINQDRVAGMDLLPDLLADAKENSLKCFIYGGSEVMLAKSEEYIKSEYPGLECSYFSPPFRALTNEEESEHCQMINDFGAHLVFVALGCPKQEKWMARMKDKVNACMLGIGGALPVMIGMQDRAPSWMQKYSLEWLYRLAQEPKRLFKRYAYTNTKFLYLLTKQKLGLLK